MKPARFRYARPPSITAALSLLASTEDAKVLAGGQSLVPTMNFRLAQPSVLIDINHIKELDLLEIEDGYLKIGALIRHSRFETPVVEDPLGKLLSTASRSVGHLPIRVRGTFAGSIAHADPAAEWCLIARTVDAYMIASSERGRREIPAESFFEMVFTTALEPDELLTEVWLPLLGSSSHVGFSEFSRRAGDFALVSSAIVTWVEHGRISSASIGVGGLGSRPERATEAEAALVGHSPSEELFTEAADIAAGEFEPLGDIHGSAEYRRQLVSVLVKRALQQTLETSRGSI
jgi:aerobic carbon-monoxide dehydrogenase medium subunit